MTDDRTQEFAHAVLDRLQAELRQYLEDATCAVKAERDAAHDDADRLAASLKEVLDQGAVSYIPDYFRRKCGYGEASSRARAALAHHQEQAR